MKSLSNIKRLPGFLHLDRYSLGALALISLAVAIRVSLLALGWPVLDSDDATIGLMGMHIAFHGELPIFFYGQSYMGASEAYIASLMFRLFGVSVFTLLLGLVLLYTLFLAALYVLTSLLYTKDLALVTLALLAFGSNSMLTHELVALGGYPDTLLFGTLLLLLSTWLALTSHADSPRKYRLFAFTAWGLVAGLGLWTHLLVAPFVLISLLFLLFFCWRDLLSLAPLLLILGFIVGVCPLIVYNLSVPLSRNTFVILLHVHEATGLALPPKSILFHLQLRGTFLIALPLATGANPICAIPDIHSFDLSSVHQIHCTLVHSGWSAGLLIGWLAAFILCLAGLAYLLWWRSHNEEWSEELRISLVRQSGRLALLGTGLLTFLLYVFSPDAAIYPVATSRYLIGLLVCTPAILWPLWNGAHALSSLLRRLSSQHKAIFRLEQGATLLGRSVIILIGLVLLLGTFAVFTGYPPAPPVEKRAGIYVVQVNDRHLDVAAARALDRQQYALAADILQLGIKHIYSDYWTCNRIIFQSHEQIICKVLTDNLESTYDRYRPYRGIVLSDPLSSYVFEQNTPPALLFAKRLVTDPHYHNYQHFVRDGYDIFQPMSGGQKADPTS